MPAPITFTIQNAVVLHQVTLSQDCGNSRTIIAMIDGIEYHLDDSLARKDGKGFQGSDVTVIVAQTTLTVIQMGHVTFSGIITDDVSRRIILFIVDCGLPEIK